MGTSFDDAWQAGGALDDHFGEAFLIAVVPVSTPTVRVDVNAPARPPNPTLSPPVPFIGTWRSAPVERFPESRGHASSDAQQVSSGLVAVEYRAAALPFVPKGRDQVTRVSTGAVYEVVDPGTELHGRRRMRLSGQVG